MPYDHSRVKLSVDKSLANAEGLDYINANFIQGFNSKKDFVATQGPKEITVGEFWQMVWEIDSPGIVMLTRLKEKKGNREVEKCYRFVNITPTVLTAS